MSLGGKGVGRLQWLKRSSTLRLTLLLSAVFAVGMLLAIVAALAIGRSAVLARVDTSLLNLARTLEVEQAPVSSNPSIIFRTVDQLADLPKGFERAARRGSDTIELEEPFQSADTWRTLITQGSNGEPVLIATPLDDSEDALELLSGILWTTISVVLCFTLLLGLVIGLLAQRRFSRIKHTLDRLSMGDLKARTGVVTTQDDLGDLAQQIDSTADDLERLVTQTRHLSASLAHDLRTPLARLHAKLEDLPAGEARVAALVEANRLREIFDTIMRLARIEAGRGQEGFERLDLNELVEEVAEIFGPVVEDNGKHLVVTVAHPATIFADRKMLIQALANLIQNAIVHGGQTITLDLSGSRVSVSDDGPGVDPSHFDEILKPMVRLDTARATEGTGLGLALVKAVVDRHGADLGLSNKHPSGLSIALNFTAL